MTDSSIEQVLREHGGGYNAAPAEGPPLEKMWAEIEGNTGARWNNGMPRRRSRALIGMGLAASLLVGFALGRSTGRVASNAGSAAAVAANGEDALYTEATSRYLVQTAALLLALPSGSGAAVKLDSAFVVRASDLLSTTRLLIDSPAAGNPDLRSLMSDLEIVLAQIVQLRPQPLRGELDLIAGALQERELLPRIQTAVTMAANN
jgi:hypothetical protein